MTLRMISCSEGTGWTSRRGGLRRAREGETLIVGDEKREPGWGHSLEVGEGFRDERSFRGRERALEDGKEVPFYDRVGF